MRALVSAADVVVVLEEHIDKLHDAARRLGCTEDEAYEAVHTAVGELVGDLAERPETVGDLVGGLYARARDTAGRVRRGGGAPVALDEQATGSLLGDTAEVRATEDTLFDLPERRRFGVLLIDSYALSLPQAAVALGLDAAETARTVALGRLAVVAGVDDRRPPSLSGHDTAVGDLGMLADGTAPVGGRFAALRRHVSSCATCAGVLGVQTRGRGLVAALPVLGLSADDRREVLATAASRAAAALPSADEVQAELAGEVEVPPLIPWYVVGLALVVALLLGVGVGVLARGDGGPDVSSAGVVTSTTSSAAQTSAPAPPASVIATTSSTSPAVTRSRTVSTSAPPASTSARTSAPPTSSAPPVAVARISLSPASGPDGTVITVSGVGFPPAALVSITYSRPDGTHSTTGSTTTDGSGRFSSTITASDPATAPILGNPSSHAGPHAVTASVGTVTRTATFDQTT